MITKTYTSRGVITFSLRIGQANKTFRFTHTPVGGGSVYTTSNKAEQEALEASPYFGKSYILTGASGTEDVRPETPVAQEPKVIKLHDIEEARDYLMDNYGYKASDLRSRKSIMETAISHGFEFDGI